MDSRSGEFTALVWGRLGWVKVDLCPGRYNCMVACEVVRIIPVLGDRIISASSGEWIDVVWVCWDDDSLGCCLD